MKRAALILLLIFPVFFPHHAQAAEKSAGVSYLNLLCKDCVSVISFEHR